MKGVRLVVFAVIVVSLGVRIAQDSYKIDEYYKAIEKYRKANRKEKDRAKRTEYLSPGDFTFLPNAGQAWLTPMSPL